MTEFVIEDVPVVRQGRDPKYPFARMKIGQSFVVPVALGLKLRRAACMFCKRCDPSKKFSVLAQYDRKGVIVHYRVGRIQ